MHRSDLHNISLPSLIEHYNMKELARCSTRWVSKFSMEPSSFLADPDDLLTISEFESTHTTHYIFLGFSIRTYQFLDEVYERIVETIDRKFRSQEDGIVRLSNR